jgi:hypothetical protein
MDRLLQYYRGTVLEREPHRADPDVTGDSFSSRPITAREESTSSST